MTQRIHDANGWWQIDRNPISRVGVFPYSGRQIGAPDPDKIYMVLRPPEELGSPETLDSFRLMPITDDHTMLGDGRGLTPAERKGAHGTIGDRVEFDGETLYGNIKIWSSSMHDKIAGGKRELSCGYRCAYDFTSGTWRGQNYDVVQRQMRGNHLALVKQGRMGPDVCVQDHVTMDAQEFVRMDPELKALLAALDAKVSAMDTALAAIPTLTASVTALDAKVSAMDSEPTEDDMAALKAANEKKAKEAEDATTALITKAVDSAIAAREKAKPAPAAMDAKEVIASVNRGQALAKRLVPHIGTFDASSMDEKDVAKYGYDKLVETKLMTAPGAALDDAALLPVLDTWLTATDVKRPVAAADAREPGALTGASLFSTEK